MKPVTFRSGVRQDNTKVNCRIAGPILPRNEPDSHYIGGECPRDRVHLFLCWQRTEHLPLAYTHDLSFCGTMKSPSIMKLRAISLLLSTVVILPAPAATLARRLNRYEYNATIRDLLGVDFRATNDFPADN